MDSDVLDQPAGQDFIRSASKVGSRSRIGFDGMLGITIGVPQAFLDLMTKLNHEHAGARKDCAVHQRKYLERVCAGTVAIVYQQLKPSMLLNLLLEGFQEELAALPTGGACPCNVVSLNQWRRNRGPMRPLIPKRTPEEAHTRIVELMRARAVRQRRQKQFKLPFPEGPKG